MSGPEFWQTGYGRRFFDAQLPELIKQVERAANAIEKLSGQLEARTVKISYWKCDGCGFPDNAIDGPAATESCSNCGSLRKDDVEPSAAQLLIAEQLSKMGTVELGKEGDPTGRQRRKIAREKKQPTKAKDRVLLGRGEDIAPLFAGRIADLKQECFWVVGMTVRNHLIGIVEVARGSLTNVEVHPREVFRPLIEMAAAGAVVVHNHPSGDPAPSAADIELTRRLRQVGDLVGIPVIDHIVLGEAGSFRSIAELLGSEF